MRKWLLNLSLKTRNPHTLNFQHIIKFNAKKRPQPGLPLPKPAVAFFAPNEIFNQIYL
jgi:hypothetical protein